MSTEAQKPQLSIEEALFARIFMAIVQIESGGELNAVGDQGRAVGPAQIHVRYVKDAQAVDPGITLDMRWSLEGSKRIVRAYMRRWSVPLHNAEMVARVHNGGPKGYLKPQTLRYWKKVNSVLQQPKHSGTGLRREAVKPGIPCKPTTSWNGAAQTARQK